MFGGGRGIRPIGGGSCGAVGVGGLPLGDLPPGAWRLLEESDLRDLFFATDEHG